MRSRRGSPWLVLATLSLGFFMTLLDLTAVNVAVPTLITDLGASLDEVLWVINVYILVLAALLISTGRLADLWGPRALFVGGVALFTAASALCALAQDPAQLIAARAVQGLGAVALIPQTMTIIMGVFPAERRGTALGVWGAVAGMATVAGPTVGGLLVSVFGWRAIFLVNLPIGVAVLVLALVTVPTTRAASRRGIDWVGAVLATAALLCVTYALTEGQRFAWNAGILGLLGLGGLLLVVFGWHQARHQAGQPLVPFALFRDRGYAGMSLVAAAVQVGMIGLFLPVMLYLQTALGLDALRAGLVMAPAMVASALLSPVAGHVADRWAGRHDVHVVAVGLVLFAGGLALLAATIDVDRTWWQLQPALVTAGLGIGCLFGPMVGIAMRGVAPASAGAASGVLNTIRQIGTILGSAALGAVFQARLAGALDHETVARAYVDAARPALVLPAAVVALATAACLLLRTRRRTVPDVAVPDIALTGGLPALTRGRRDGRRGPGTRTA